MSPGLKENMWGKKKEKTAQVHLFFKVNSNSWGILAVWILVLLNALMVTATNYILAECFIGISSSVLRFCLHTSASGELSSVQAVVTSWRITGQGSDDCHFGENTQHLKQQVSCHQGCVSYKEVKPKHEQCALHSLRSASCLCYLTTLWTCFPWHSLHLAPFRNSILKFRRLCLLWDQISPKENLSSCCVLYLLSILWT